MAIAEIPGPKGVPFFGMMFEFARDLFGYAERLREHGDVVRVDIARMRIHYLLHPDHAAHVLVHRSKLYTKGARAQRARIVFGDGLVLSEGELWRRQRQLMLPAFHPRRLAEAGAAMSAAIEGSLASWRDGDRRAVDRDMNALALEVALRVLFGTQAGEDTAKVREAFTAMSSFAGSVAETVVQVPLWVPLPRNLRFRAASERLEEVVRRVIAERRASPDLGQDVLGVLLSARDEQGQPMDDGLLRSEVRTLLVAGHDTTGLGLAAALWELSGDAALQDRVAEQIRQTLGDRAPTVADLPALAIAEAVFKEALRLWPPVPVILREATEDDEIGGYLIPKGANVIINLYSIQRDPRFYSNPARFDPYRWTPEMVAALPRFAWAPFGGGPRVCIGMTMALQEATLALAELLRRYRFTRPPDATWDLMSGITLKPKRPVELIVNTR